MTKNIFSTIISYDFVQQEETWPIKKMIRLMTSHGGLQLELKNLLMNFHKVRGNLYGKHKVCGLTYE